MERYVRNEQVAILRSGGPGRGWSTANRNPKFMAMDHQLVEYALNGDSIEEVMNYIEEKTGYEPIMDAWEVIDIVWLPIGQRFLIMEYDDGTEGIITEQDLKFEA